MKITGNIFANNYWLMKFAPLALALAAVVIFFFNLYVHIWNGTFFLFLSPVTFFGQVQRICHRYSESGHSP